MLRCVVFPVGVWEWGSLTLCHSVQHHVDEYVRAGPACSITEGRNDMKHFLHYAASHQTFLLPAVLFFFFSFFTCSGQWLGRSDLCSIYSPFWSAERERRRKINRENTQHAESDFFFSLPHFGFVALFVYTVPFSTVLSKRCVCECISCGSGGGSYQRADSREGWKWS